MTQRAWTRLFPDRGTLVGMVHVRPLPGSPRWGGSMSPVLDAALDDARTLVAAGFDALMIENYGDVPFHPGPVPPATIASLTAVVQAVRSATDARIGVNVLRNDAASALAIASATGASFVRVNVHTGSMWTDQGLLQGRAEQTLRLRASLGVEDVAILSDVHVKHALPPAGSSLATAASDSWFRGLADALLVTGTGTGSATDLNEVKIVRTAVADAPVLVASGVTSDAVRAALEAADGVIVGSAVMHEGRAGAGVDPDRARAFVQAARG